ncbi:ABC transporter ATP-binding protein [Lachnoclostridium sp.]|uniref:ABC transporter ATP-binding protein n=1 Tax=Lachnoclostridium sp. TaxID=2028282 RepID=UPI00289AE410|nr:ABC transporter ATP-binding protein [Lachnoclostridium sp.]
MNGITIEQVSKRFGSVVALDNINLSLSAGKIYGLLGRNGAGKSTLLNVITNRLFAESGKVIIDGEKAIENDEALAKIYYMSEGSSYPENYSVNDVFRSAKLLYGEFDFEYAKKLCKKFDLNVKKKIKGLSTGYGSIYKIITALCLPVPYLLLDEPVLGLDANHRELFYQLILEDYNRYERTIVISTHLIEEVSGLIEEVIIIDKGKVIRQESCEEILNSGYTVTGKVKDIEQFIKNKNVLSETSLGGLRSVCILGKLNRAEIPDTLEITKLDLQKLFVNLTREKGEMAE